MSVIYDRTFRVPVWVVLDLPKKTNQALVERLCEDGVYHQQWPARTFINTVKDLGNKGWKHVVDQPKPFNLDVNFLAFATATHIRNTFGENVLMAGNSEVPFQHLNRRIQQDSDYETVFNTVLANERDVSLSQIFGLAELKTKVYVTESPVNKHLIGRLAGKTLTVSETDGTIIVKGKKPDEIYDIIVKEIEKALHQ